MEWFRWYHGTVSDPKFSVIARRSRQPRHVVMACWPAILEHASTRRSRGSLEGIDLEEIAVVLDLETDQVEAVYQAMIDKGMIEGERLKNWEKRQPVREDETGHERKQRWKDKQKAEQTGTQGNAAGTHPERTGTQGDTTETPGTCKNRTEQNREDKNRKEEKQTPPPAPMTLFKFRQRYRETFGTELGGGVNSKLSEICQNYTEEAIENALLSAATRLPKPKNPFMYLLKILEGIPESTADDDRFDPDKDYPEGSFLAAMKADYLEKEAIRAS